jgi:hypothetical protein
VNWPRALLSRILPEETRAPEDVAFDTVYPRSMRAISRRFWTPAVARRAANLFQHARVRRVLDVGSGVGKFVLVAAAETPDITFTGIEQREHLVTTARTAQLQLRVPNASFLVGEATEISWSDFDGFYFFNPFAENLFDSDERIDGSVELTRERFRRDVIRIECALRAARLGAAVVTYHGMSARMPGCFEPVRSERAGSDYLRLWVKTRESADGFYLDLGDGIVLHGSNGQPV